MPSHSSNTENKTLPGFLASEILISSPEKSLFHIIPVPFEQSVSYGAGTKDGPTAIIEASQQLEFYDGISCPGEQGIHTLAPIINDTAEAMLTAVSTTVGKIVTGRKIPVMLGGEHTVTHGAILGLSQHGSFGVVQIDAHADLRDSYEDSSHSHACVMRRIADRNIPVFQIGIRSLSLAEVDFRQEKKISYVDMSEIHLNGIPENILPENFPGKIYLTIDVDSLDPSIMPATGTPEPGGLSWQQTMTILENLTRKRRIIGFDVVELAPIAELHFAEYTVARLIYNLMGFITRNR